MAQHLATASRSANLYRCTVDTATGDFVTGAQWRKRDDATRCPTLSRNRPRLGKHVNNNNPTPICETHILAIEAERAATYNGNLTASLSAVTDAAWMQAAHDAAWLKAATLAQRFKLPNCDTLNFEWRAAKAEEAIVKTLTRDALALYPLPALIAVDAAFDESLIGTIRTVNATLDTHDELDTETVAEGEPLTDGFRPDVLDGMRAAGHIDEAEILVRVAKSARMVEPTRNDNREFIRGEMVLRMDTIDGAREAARLYLRTRNGIDGGHGK